MYNYRRDCRIVLLKIRESNISVKRNEERELERQNEAKGRETRS